MTPKQLMEARLKELHSEADGLLNQRGAIIDAAAAEKRGFTEAEQASYDELGTKRASKLAEIKPVEERIVELTELEVREANAAKTRALAGDGKPTGNAQVTDPPIYVRGGETGNFFFRDLKQAMLQGNSEAADRLRRNTAMVTETRAIGNTGAVGGSGGEFAPPEWLVEDYIAVIRSGRVTANLFNKMSIPTGVSNINLPKVLTGTTVTLQSTQNSALSQTDITTGFVQTGFATLGGKAVVSQQLLDQAAIPFDRVITTDLAAAYTQQVGQQVLIGTGTGSGTTSVVNGLGNATIPGTNATTWTQAAPTVAGFYGQCAKTVAAFATNRLAEPTAWLMHPRRWYWLIATPDSQGRPLVVPQGVAMNPIATMDGLQTQGLAGMFLGLPVYIDPNVPTNLGAGTNQDIVYLLKPDDLWFFESDPRSESFTATYADSDSVLFRLVGYVGTMLNRYTASIATVSGTGLITPTFAS